mgnify:CR=1 FL=1|jgi:hypothetical protein|tara:strand:- start:1473 stop:1679 length:207 start_codon:yes stop_codon:yes gene_type:complete
MPDTTTKRISLPIDEALYERLSKMPWGMRSPIVRVLLERVIDAGEKHGAMIYGAILDGHFDIVYKEKK